MRFTKLLTVPAVLLVTALMAAPAFAHSLQAATVAVQCGTGDHAGQVCVHLTGTIERDNAERFVFVDVFAPDSTTSLGEIKFHLPAFNGHEGASNRFDETLCFPAIANSPEALVAKIVKVTSDSAGMHPADLAIHVTGGATISFGNENQHAATVGRTEKCVAPTPTPTPTATTTSTATPAANTTVALAQTGGFDFRLPLIGLTLLVAGGALFVVSVSRGRSASRK